MSKLFPNPTPTDPNIRLPRGRRVIWEHAEDVRVANTWLTIISVVLAFVCILETGVLLSIYKRPPQILQEDAGYVMWRTADVYKLREDIVKTFVNTTLGTLMEVHPGAYDLSSLDGLVDTAILKRFSDDAQMGGADRLSRNSRRLFAIYDMRRWVNPRAPNYIAIAVRGEKVSYEEVTDEAGNKRVTSDSKLALYVIYLQQRTPVPKNPWGLHVAGIQEAPASEAERVWSESVPIANSKDSKGNAILPPKSSK